LRNLYLLGETRYYRDYLRQMIEVANALIVVVDKNERIADANRAMQRFTDGEAAARPLLGESIDLLAAAGSDGTPALVEILRAGLVGDEHSDTEVWVARQPGPGRAVFNTSTLRLPDGGIGGVIAIGQDIMRLRSLEHQVIQVEKLATLGQLAAGVVHELNNPLTAVTMFSDALLEKWQGGGDAADVEKMRAIREAGLRIQRLARDLIAYARPSGVRIEPCDVAGALDEAARMAKPALKEANATVVRRFEAVPPVEANRPSLVQVFVNLVTNAAQALKPGGGTVTLALANEGERVRVQVCDDGTGMTSEVRARAFEPFFTTRPGLGIGLGLPIVQEIVDRHRGQVEVETALGTGTTVSVALPVRHA